MRVKPFDATKASRTFTPATPASGSLLFGICFDGGRGQERAGSFHRHFPTIAWANAVRFGFGCMARYVRRREPSARHAEVSDRTTKESRGQFVFNHGTTALFRVVFTHKLTVRNGERSERVDMLVYRGGGVS